jgi:hypothetical protein
MLTRLMVPSSLFEPVKLVVLFLMVGLPALANLDTIADLFSTGRYEEARQSLEQGGEGLRVGEEALWRAQLSADPGEALVILREGLSDRRVPPEVRTRMALESANIEFGLGRYQSSFKALTAVLEENQVQLPGEVYLRAGLSLRALGHLQKAREMLASVRPQDPSFLLARYYLGDIALEQKEPDLALRYFEAAAGNRQSSPHPRVAAGQWKALLAQERGAEALALEENLQREHPGSLAMLEIQRLMREQKEEVEALSLSELPDQTSQEKEPARGRFALQLGAFSDRSLALEFLRRYQDQLPDLRIDEVRDARGQFLYKVRTGSFVNPALARSEAKRLADQLDLDVFVADLSGSGDETD